MNAYRLNDIVQLADDEGHVFLKRYADSNIEGLIAEVIHTLKMEKAFAGNKYHADEDFNSIVFMVAEKMPKYNLEEKSACAILLQLLMKNKEAIIGLSQVKGDVKIDFIEGKLFAMVDKSL